MNDVDQPFTLEAPVCREGDNTLDTGPIPIVFVPGVMGSRLYFPSIDEWWDPDSDWRMFHWLRVGAETARVELGATTTRARVATTMDDRTAEQLARGWAGVSWKYYGQFVQDLQAQSFGNYRTPVYVVGYDWRQDNRNSGDYVARKIRDMLEREHADRYIMVSHSMGGMVTRACLKNNSDVADKLAGIVHIAQPVHGGLVLVRRMFTGAISGVDGDWKLCAVLGNDRRKAQTIVAGMIGPMELLVTRHYRDIGGGWWYDYKTFEQPTVTQRWEGNAWDLYTRPESPPGLLPPANKSYSVAPAVRTQFLQTLATARRFHEWLDLWKHDKTWAIYSTGLTVDTKVTFELPPVNSEMHVIPSYGMGPPAIYYTARRADGSEVTLSDPDPPNRGNVLVRRNRSDGTVPDFSAEGLFPGQHHAVAAGSDYENKRQFRISGAAHDAICHAGACERCLFDIIRHIVGS